MTQLNDAKLEYNSVYHIYNCGINGCNLFISDDDYDRFLSKYSKYIEPIADTFAWCLLGNHFHIVVRIKNESEIKTLEELGLCDKKTTMTIPNKKPDPTRQFSHLFNSYSQQLISRFNNQISIHCRSKLMFTANKYRHYFLLINKITIKKIILVNYYYLLQKQSQIKQFTRIRTKYPID